MQSFIGKYPLGFRIAASGWQQDLTAVIQFALERKFRFLDTGPLPAKQLREIISAGLEIGSVDIVQPWDGLTSSNALTRKKTIDAMVRQIHDAAEVGVRHFFMVAFPEDQGASRMLSFRLLVDSLDRLSRAVKATTAKIVIEGYPGKPPYFAPLVCTPEGYRTLFYAVEGNTLGINFDPSHLIRMGIDPERFLLEFGDRVYHVHAKDTALDAEGLYEFGHTQQPLKSRREPYAGPYWRYAIPGRGVADWRKLLSLLHGAEYRGRLSIELEDRDYHGTEELEKAGLLAAAGYLKKLRPKK